MGFQSHWYDIDNRYIPIEMDLSFGVLPCSGSDGSLSSSRQCIWECIIFFHSLYVLYIVNLFTAILWLGIWLHVHKQHLYPQTQFTYIETEDSITYLQNSYIRVLLHSILSQKDVVHRTRRGRSDFAIIIIIYAIFAKSCHKRLPHSFLKYTAYVAQRRKIIPWDKCLVFWPSRISRVSGSIESLHLTQTSERISEITSLGIRQWSIRICYLAWGSSRSYSLRWRKKSPCSIRRTGTKEWVNSSDVPFWGASSPRLWAPNIQRTPIFRKARHLVDSVCCVWLRLGCVSSLVWLFSDSSLCCKAKMGAPEINS